MKRKREPSKSEELSILSVKDTKIERKTEDRTEDVNLKISMDYLDLLKKFKQIEKQDQKSLSLEKCYPMLIENRCTAGDFHRDSDSDKAITAYREALEHFDQWNRYKTSLGGSPVEDNSLSTPTYINQESVIHYNLHVLYSRRENLNDLKNAADHLQIAILKYQWLVKNDSEKKPEYQEHLRVCLNDQEEINHKINDLKKIEANDRIDNFSIYSRVEPVSSIYGFEHAPFIFNSIKISQHPTKIVFKCRDFDQKNAIENWLHKEEILTFIGGKPIFNSQEQFELVAESQQTVFHLRQWQKLNDKINHVLVNKNYPSLFESISKCQTSAKKLCSVGKRLKLLALYQDKLSSRISEEDLSSFKEAYVKAELLLKNQQEKLKAVSEKKKNNKQEKLKRLSEPSSKKIEIALTPIQENSQDDAVLLSETTKGPQQTIFSQVTSANTNPIIFQAGNHFASMFSSGLQQMNSGINSFGATTQNPFLLTTLPSQPPLSALAAAASSDSASLSKLTKQQLEQLDTSKLEQWKDQKIKQLQQQLVLHTQNLIKEIKNLQIELGLPIYESLSLAGTETLDVLREKKQTYEKSLNELRKLKNEKTAAINEIPINWKNIRALWEELKLDPSTMPVQKNLSEITTFPLLIAERDRARTELEKLKEKRKQRNNLIAEINSYDEELEQLNTTKVDKPPFFRFGK